MANRILVLRLRLVEKNVAAAECAFFGGVCSIEDIFELHGDLLRTCSTERAVSMLLSAESNACTFKLSSSFSITD